MRVFCTLEETVQALQGGEIVLFTTDTLPGLHCRADDPAVVARLRRLKGRAADKPLLLLAASAAAACALTPPWTDRIAAYVQRCWPGPFTLVFPARPGWSLEPDQPCATVAVRVPAPAILRELVAKVGCPLVSTSANRAGESAPTGLSSAQAVFAADDVGVWQRPEDETVESASGSPAEVATASTVIDLTVWPPRVLRPGSTPPPAPADDVPACFDR